MKPMMSLWQGKTLSIASLQTGPNILPTIGQTKIELIINPSTRFKFNKPYLRGRRNKRVGTPRKKRL